MEDQDGNTVHLPPSEKKAIIIALALYEKGKISMKNEKYDEALVFYHEADAQFTSCSSKILNYVDNYALLNLDIVWCYLCLKSFSQLSDAERRLNICAENFERSYGRNMDRLISLKGNSTCAEMVLFARLHLLQGVLYFHQNRRNDAYEKFLLTESELQNLKVDDDKLVMLLEMGYNTGEARIALRTCNGDIDSSISYILQQRQKRQEAREKAREENIVNQKSVQPNRDEDWVNPKNIYSLVQMGYNRDLAAIALKKSNNDLTLAIDYLHNNRQELEEQLPKLAEQLPKDDVLKQLIELGFDSGIAEQALKAAVNTDCAIEWILKQQSEGTLSEMFENLEKVFPDSSGDCTRFESSSSSMPSTSAGNHSPNLIKTMKEKVKSKLEASDAYARFSDGITIDENDYLDVPLIQEEIILLEYKNALEK